MIGEQHDVDVDDDDVHDDDGNDFDEDVNENLLKASERGLGPV